MAVLEPRARKPPEQKVTPRPQANYFPVRGWSPPEHDTSARAVLHPLNRRKLPPEPIEKNHCWDL